MGDAIFRIILSPHPDYTGDVPRHGPSSVQRLGTYDGHRHSGGTNHGGCLACVYPEPGLCGSLAGVIHTQTQYAADHAEAGNFARAACVSPEPDRLASFRLAGICGFRTGLYSAGDAVLEEKLESSADFDGTCFKK